MTVSDGPSPGTDERSVAPLRGRPLGQGSVLPSRSRRASGGRVDVSPEAAELLRRLRGTHGPLMFHQSGGCCDGSAPMCNPAGEFRIGERDVHLGDLGIDAIEPVPVWMSGSQFEYWKHTPLTIDVVPGRGSGFSLEAPEGVRF